MPANKNALIRYRTIDRCLRNRYRRWTLEDLVDACSDALYEMEGITKGVSVRTVQGDIQMMRSDKLGYNAPIEVYDHKYYRYEDPEYTITEMPMTENDLKVLHEAVGMLRQLEGFGQFTEMADVIGRLQDKLAISGSQRKPVIHFDSVPELTGIRLLSPLYDYIVRRQTMKITYQSFNARQPSDIILYPYLLKEFRNRWFLFGSKPESMKLVNLALDRIKCVEPADVPFAENPEFDPEHFFDDVIGVSKDIGARPVTIKFWASANQSRYIRTKPVHKSQRLIEENKADRSCVFEIDVVVNHEMYSVFMSYGPGVRILSPRHVVKYMREQLQSSIGLYC